MTFQSEGIECARLAAQELLDQFGVESVDHVRVEAFAERLGVELIETELHGADAQLVVGAGRAHILLSDRLTDPAARRWAICHELGHFVLEHDAAPAADLCAPRARCRARRRHRRHQEDEANGFAMVVLMPADELAAVCDARPMTLEACARLAERCSVPLAAAACRITEVTFRICAAVLSKDGTVRRASPSLRFLALYGRGIAVGKQLDPQSLAGQFFQSGVVRGDPQLVPTSVWLDGYAGDSRILEHSVMLREPGTVLTMLWAPSEPRVARDIGLNLGKTSRARDYMLGELHDESPAE